VPADVIRERGSIISKTDICICTTRQEATYARQLYCKRVALAADGSGGYDRSGCTPLLQDESPSCSISDHSHLKIVYPMQQNVDPSSMDSPATVGAAVTADATPWKCTAVPAAAAAITELAAAAADATPSMGTPVLLPAFSNAACTSQGVVAARSPLLAVPVDIEGADDRVWEAGTAPTAAGRYENKG
jgi:hypothetical protein